MSRSRALCEQRAKGAENKFILQIEQISEKIIRLKRQIDSIHFYVILKRTFFAFFTRSYLDDCIPLSMR